MAAALSTTRTATARTSPESSPANGAWRRTRRKSKRPMAVSRYLKTDTEDVEYQETRLDGISGMAPQCKLVSLRVLDEDGKGAVSNLIAAISHVQEKNGYGRRLVIHGVNMSLGYNFEPEWFACGQSPLCVEVDRLVKSGVVVVVAAGNTGYGTLKSTIGATSAGMALTINDPGNADLAITVGSTHRDMPHVYGVSYFSSKGPTGDGRLKPDLVAPGEKIISCAAGNLKAEGAKGQRPCDYVETSGTSMAAPHVSGVIAAFLSVRGEFIGKAERVKEIFISTAPPTCAATAIFRAPASSISCGPFNRSELREPANGTIHHERHRRNSLCRSAVRQERRPSKPGQISCPPA